MIVESKGGLSSRENIKINQYKYRKKQIIYRKKTTGVEVKVTLTNNKLLSEHTSSCTGDDSEMKQIPFIFWRN